MKKNQKIGNRGSYKNSSEKMSIKKFQKLLQYEEELDESSQIKKTMKITLEKIKLKMMY